MHTITLLLLLSIIHVCCSSRVLEIHPSHHVLSSTPTLRDTLRADRARAIDLSTGNISWSSGSQYVVRTSIGTPPTELFLTLDSSTDLSWIQCAPCVLCSVQEGPIFTPSDSSTYLPTPCNASSCQKLPSHNCQAEQCQFLTTSRGGSAVSYGDLCSDSFLFDSTTVGNLTFGCSHATLVASASSSDENTIDQASVSAGIFAIGRGDLSLPSQLGSNVYSYCLPHARSESVGTLTLNDESFLQEAVTTPLVTSPTNPSVYYVNLTGVTVGDEFINIPVSDYGSGGLLLIDTITSVTTLPIDIYTVVRNQFLSLTPDIPLTVVDDNDQLDTCYNMSGVFGNNETEVVPEIVLHFEGGANMSLPMMDMMVEDDTEENVYCLAFATPLYGTPAIFGTIQQQGFYMAIDVENQVLAIGPHSMECVF